MNTLYRPYPYVSGDGWDRPSTQGRHAVRGGSWVLNPWDLRASNREFGEAGYRSVYIGFRCARS